MNLIDRVKQVLTIGDKHPIYAKATVEIRDFEPDEVRPISKYILRGNLHRLNQLRTKIDIFTLDEVVDTGDGCIGPPVVERDGDTDCIVDGLHRFAIAKIKGKRVRSVYVTGADRPLIGNPIEWGDVSIRRERPTTAGECRDMKVEDNPDTIRQHYRDFSFMGSTGRRPRDGQKN